jgi:small subunit ribosomal protein S14
MARKSLIAREVKRKAIVAKYKVARTQMLEDIKSSSGAKKMKLMHEFMRKFPADSAPVRGRNRCALTGRPRGYYRKFGLSRNELRRLAMLGLVPGIQKASW